MATKKKPTTTAIAERPPAALTVRLADLLQTEHVKFARTTVGNWPLLNIGAFIGQSREDEGELDRVCGLYKRAFTDAVALLATWHGHRDEAIRLRALNAAFDKRTDAPLIEHYTRMLLALGVAYGVRLATTAQEEGAR